MGRPRNEHTFRIGRGWGKTCTKCGEWKPLSDFHNRRASPDGLQYQCKACRKVDGKQWRLDNPEYGKRYNKQYRPNHLQALAQYQNKHNAAKRGCTRHHTEEEWEILCEIYDHRCVCCGEQEPFQQYRIALTRDHIIPPELGGEDGIDNIQPLCHLCNSVKHQSTWDFRCYQGSLPLYSLWSEQAVEMVQRQFLEAVEYNGVPWVNEEEEL